MTEFLYSTETTEYSKTAGKFLSKYTYYPKMPSANEETSLTGIIQAAQLGNSELLKYTKTWKHKQNIGKE